MKMLHSKLRIRRVFTSTVAVSVLLGTYLVTYKAVAQDLQTDDPVLRAMRAELDREQAQLVLPGMQRPYFIQYRLDDVSTYDVVANFGPANQYLPTDATTKLQIRGSTWGSTVGLMEVLTRLIRPVSGSALFA